MFFYLQYILIKCELYYCCDEKNNHAWFIYIFNSIFKNYIYLLSICFITWICYSLEKNLALLNICVESAKVLLRFCGMAAKSSWSILRT